MCPNEHKGLAWCVEFVFHSLRMTHNIGFSFVKGDSGVERNERADRAADLGMPEEIRNSG